MKKILLISCLMALSLPAIALEAENSATDNSSQASVIKSKTSQNTSNASQRVKTNMKGFNPTPALPTKKGVLDMEAQYSYTDNAQMLQQCTGIPPSPESVSNYLLPRFINSAMEMPWTP